MTGHILNLAAGALALALTLAPDHGGQGPDDPVRALLGRIDIEVPQVSSIGEPAGPEQALLGRTPSTAQTAPSSASGQLVEISPVHALLGRF